MKTSGIIDRMLVRALLFIILFVWIKYFYPSIWISALSAAALSLAVASLFELLTAGRRKKQRETRKEAAARAAAAAALCFNTDAENIELLKKVLQAVGHECSTDKGVLLFDGRIAAVCVFKTDKLSASDAAAAYKAAKPAIERTGADMLVVFCGVTTPAAEKYAAAAPVKTVLYNGEKTYALMKRAGIFPKETEKKKQKRGKGDFARAALRRQNARGYFFAGIWIVLAGLFTRYSLYYYIFATLMMLLSLACLQNFQLSRKREKEFKL
ncbi:MAG: hypothetical protein FWE62_04000 [Firmicutes bacterium]|nr:hypothetical protein [Bacillota bacterium]